MADFKPKLNSQITIGEKTYTVTSHISGSAIKVLYLEGARGRVYKLLDKGGKAFALKVFKASHKPRNETANPVTAAYREIPGVSVYAREIVCRPTHNALLDKYPDLEFAALMPYLPGESWENFWLQPESYDLDPEESLMLARKLAGTLAQIGQKGMAHCDVSGADLVVGF